MSNTYAESLKIRFKHFYIVKMNGKKPIFSLLTDEILQTRTIEEKNLTASADILPEEKVDSVVNSYNNQIKQRLMDLIMTREASFFEQLVVELLLKMGYGYGEAAAGQVVGKSHDGGIDGIISEDKLGLGLIYIQAKRYDKAIKVGRKELQAFAGAMRTVNKGVFLTTSSRSSSWSTTTTSNCSFDNSSAILYPSLPAPTTTMRICSPLCYT